MKIMTLLGTRPEIIRLCLIIKLLDIYSQHIMVHTGQNFDDNLNGLFFRQLGLREPDIYLGIKGKTAGEQIGQILSQTEKIFLERRPDRLLILGDTNSGLPAMIACRLGIPVYHMEAGNRCYDDRVPEEVNRRIIDHSSTVLLPYTSRSRENLLREGIPGARIYVTGNPINEVIETHKKQIDSSTILTDLGLRPQSYFLVTMHRAENVDVESRLRSLIKSFTRLSSRYGFPVVVSFHPRTKAKVETFGIDVNQSGLMFVDPLGFFDFISLEKSAFCILSDSGTVQEEACIFGIPNVTIRDVTERPETIECGSNVLGGADPEYIENLVGLVTCLRGVRQPPTEYTTVGVADTVVKIMLGYRRPDPSESNWQAR